MKSYPLNDMGWHKYYVNRFNRHKNPDAAYLAMVYLFLHFSKEDPA